MPNKPSVTASSITGCISNATVTTRPRLRIGTGNDDVYGSGRHTYSGLGGALRAPLGPVVAALVPRCAPLPAPPPRLRARLPRGVRLVSETNVVVRYVMARRHVERPILRYVECTVIRWHGPSRCAQAQGDRAK